MGIARRCLAGAGGSAAGRGGGGCCCAFACFGASCRAASCSQAINPSQTTAPTRAAAAVPAILRRQKYHTFSCASLSRSIEHHTITRFNRGIERWRSRKPKPLPSPKATHRCVRALPTTPNPSSTATARQGGAARRRSAARRWGRPRPPPLHRRRLLVLGGRPPRRSRRSASSMPKSRSVRHFVGQSQVLGSVSPPQPCKV